MARETGSTLYSSRRKGVIPLLYLAVLLGLIISIERAMFNVLGEMWGTLLLDAIAMLFAVTGLLGICAKDTAIIILYSLWSVLAIALNVMLILIYNSLGLLAEKEKYLGNNNYYWKTHGIGCGLEITNSSSYQQEGSSGILSNTSGMEPVEMELGGCLIPYSTVETIHAVLYILIAVVGLSLCVVFLLCPRKNHQVENCDDEEEFSYVSIAQHFDYPADSGRSHRHSVSHWK